ncbi:hypothetical protein [Halorientalis pallida]|uniref:hypothetical protein n=1 Tax=Halorientalis pallida TaxID=2479928 RepID=UPI001D106253|nr:hypothetical protein [Halorientalis pallida]
MRLGALQSLDVDDYDGGNESLPLEHRPDMGTPLKNGEEGERLVALTAETCRVIDDWMDHDRHDVIDDYGREPMLTTENGRTQASSIRDAVYFVTRPCFCGGGCPIGRDPSNASPHDICRGSITHHSSEDVPEKVVSDRMDVGMDVLDKHYDKRSEQVKKEQRRAYLEDA